MKLINQILFILILVDISSMIESMVVRRKSPIPPPSIISSSGPNSIPLTPESNFQQKPISCCEQIGLVFRGILYTLG